MKPETKKVTAAVGGNEFVFETGKLGLQAGGSVTVSCGESVVFCAATMSKEVREGQDFFPLTVEYEERMYAGGRIPGSFFRREGRPSGDVVLTSRLIDRTCCRLRRTTRGGCTWPSKIGRASCRERV